MANKPIIQKLQHNKALTQNNFPNFVETWNGCVDRLDNIKGDYDVNPAIGSIQVDNSDWKHPVIRFVGTELSGNTPTPTSGYTGTIQSISSVGLTTSSLTFNVVNLTFQDGCIISAASSAPIEIAAQTYDNV